MLAQYCQYERRNEEDAELVRELSDLVDATYQPILLLSDYFAGVGAANGTLDIAGRSSYSSAHAAAVLEARILLEYLWIKLDKESWEEAKKAYPKNQYSEAGQKFFNATGLNPKVVEDKWEEVKQLIHHFLSPQWEGDPASGRIERELKASPSGAEEAWKKIAVVRNSAKSSKERQTKERRSHFQYVIYDKVLATKPMKIGWVRDQVRMLVDGEAKKTAADRGDDKKAPEPDGPCHPYTWCQNGKRLPDKLQRLTWKLVKHLWDKKDNTASLDSLAEPVYGDREQIVDKASVGNQRTKANRFFEDHNIPWRVQIIDEIVSLIRSEQQP